MDEKQNDTKRYKYSCITPNLLADGRLLELLFQPGRPYIDTQAFLPRGQSKTQRSLCLIDDRIKRARNIRRPYLLELLFDLVCV
jgi:hypothetical protein